MRRSEEFYADTDKLGIHFASSVKGEVLAVRYGSGKDTPLTATGLGTPKDVLLEVEPSLLSIAEESMNKDHGSIYHFAV